MAWWDNIPQDAASPNEAQNAAANLALQAAELAANGQMEAARIAAAESERYQQLSLQYSQWGYGEAQRQYAPFASERFEDSPYYGLYQWQQGEQDRAIRQAQAQRGLLGSGAGINEAVQARSGLAQNAAMNFQNQQWLANQGIANAALGVGNNQSLTASNTGGQLAQIYSTLGSGLANTYSNYGNQLTSLRSQDLQNTWNQRALDYANAQNSANRNLAYGNMALGAGRSIWDAYRGYQSPTTSYSTYNPSSWNYGGGTNYAGQPWSYDDYGGSYGGYGGGYGGYGWDTGSLGGYGTYYS